MAKNQLIEENDLLHKKVSNLKRLLTDGLYEIARYQGSLEARREELKKYPSLDYLSAELDKEIARVTRLRFEIKEAIFDR